MSTYSTSTDIILGFDGNNFSVGSDRLLPPLTIVNTNPAHVIAVSLIFNAAINDPTQYLIAGSDNIIINGLVGTPIVFADTITNYPGFIQSTFNIDIKNVTLVSSSNSNPALAPNAGWLLQSSTSGSIQMDNCTTCLPTSNRNGGLVGSYSTHVYAINCIYGGAITNESGGIFGYGCHNLAALNCSASGTIGNSSGGIFGPVCTNSNATNCSSSGAITTASGGIFGPYCNQNMQPCISAIDIPTIALYCFSSGVISGGSGGIFGPHCNYQSSLTCSAKNCYSLGKIGKNYDYDNGGIFGPLASSGCSAIACFSAGNICGDNVGVNAGIFATNASFSEATECYAIGDIGISCGAIFGTAATNCTATNCYSIGSIAEEAGGIYGSNATNSSATNCYSVGTIGSILSGGIYGYGAINSTATNCYSIGSIIANGGGIFGSSSNSSSAINCYMTGANTSGDTATNQIFSDGLVNGCVATNCFSENVGNGWADQHASVLTGGWKSIYANTPFLLDAFSVPISASDPAFGKGVSSPAPGYPYFFALPNLLVSGMYQYTQPCYAYNIYGYNLVSYPSTEPPAPIIRKYGVFTSGFSVFQTTC